MQTPTDYMQEALLEARKAAYMAEVPIGAVVVYRNKIVARAHNEVETRKDATAHAEILAIQRASEVIGDWRLKEAALYVTLEPCVMCIGALINSRVAELYFGAYDERQGAVGSVFDLSADSQLPHAIRVYPEVCADQSREMLQSFFKKLRA